jgi:hypothetical protein
VRPLSTVFQIKYDAVLVSSAESQTLITLKGFSMKTLTGINITKDIIVSTAYKLVSDRSFVLPMTFFAKIARKAEETLDNIAAMNPSHVKLNSDADAIPTPPTIGMSDA